MTVKEIDNLARYKLEPDDDITMVECGLFLSLRRLYDRFEKSTGELTVDAAKAEKERLIKRFEAEKAAIIEYDVVRKQNGDLLKKLTMHTEIFKRDDAQRVKLSGLMCEANKNGCEICRKIARVYDGRVRD